MMFRRLVVIFAAFFCIRARAETALRGDLVGLRPTAPPVVCNNGDLRVASNDSNALKICRANSWITLIDTSTGIANPYVGTISTVGIQAGSLQVTAASSFGSNVTAAGNFIGNLVGNVTGALTGTASFSTTAASSGTASTAGTASFAAASSTASFATSSTTAANAGLAAIAQISTAFASTPAGCSADQFAHHISTAGVLTCSTVTTASQAGTAAFASAYNASAFGFSATHGNDCLWARQSTSFGDTTADASCTFTLITTKNMGATAPTSYVSTNNMPGLTFTPQKLGLWELCYSTQFGNTGNAAVADIEVYDGTTEYGKKATPANQIRNNVTDCVQFTVTSATALSMWLRFAAETSGTVTVGTNGGLSNSITWTVKWLGL
jgi:hypothetical protein